MSKLMKKLLRLLYSYTGRQHLCCSSDLRFIDEPTKTTPMHKVIILMTWNHARASTAFRYVYEQHDQLFQVEAFEHADGNPSR